MTVTLDGRHLTIPQVVPAARPGASGQYERVVLDDEASQRIAATRVLMACQALALVADLSRDHPLGRGTQAALDAMRRVIAPALDGDRWYATEMKAALALVRSGAILEAVEAAVGPLA